MDDQGTEYNDVVRSHYGYSRFGSRKPQETITACRAMFDRDFPHMVFVDFKRFVAHVREIGFTGRIFDLVENWSARNAKDEWKYLTHTPYGYNRGVMFFRSADDAASFKDIFGGEAARTEPPAFPASRRVDDKGGRHVVEIGWHPVDHWIPVSQETTAAFDRIEHWCSRNVHEGLWSIVSVGGMLNGGYYIPGEFLKFGVSFTHKVDADDFADHLAIDPIGLEALSDDSVVDIGPLRWTAGVNVADLIKREMEWGLRNGIGFRMKVLTTSEFTNEAFSLGPGERSYRTLLRFPTPEMASSFRDWRENELERPLAVAP